MANQKHLEILKKGVPAWNQWRMQNTRNAPDLSEAKLNKADLSGVYLVWADLGGADFSEAKLSGADLSEANLINAKFHWANLTRANLSRAKLSGADLSEATFIEANLREAILIAANLNQADLRSADLTGAKLSEAGLRKADLIGADLHSVDLRRADFADSVMGHTLIVNVDLSGVNGLETVYHSHPSFIGIETIYKSQGNIPEAFLRGAGVPEPFIVQMKAMVEAMDPIEFYSCFISYSSIDHEFAERLYADLQQKNVRCWFAPEDIKIGDKFRQTIDEAIRVHDKLLLVVTESSMKSAWVEKEVETAFEKERKQGRTVLFPIRLDDAVMEADEAWAADIRRTRHIGDFCGWKEHDKYENAFGRLDARLEGRRLTERQDAPAWQTEWIIFIRKTLAFAHYNRARSGDRETVL